MFFGRYASDNVLDRCPCRARGDWGWNPQPKLAIAICS